MPMLKPNAPRSLTMRYNQPMTRAFSFGRSMQHQGRSWTSHTRARIDPIRQPVRPQAKRSFSSSHKNPESLSQRLRKLSREYGWSALGVYLLLSAMDFPFCFAAVKLLGADRIGHYEDMILQTVADGIHAVWPEKQPSSEEEAAEAAKEEEEKKKLKEEEAVAKKADEASMFFLKTLSWNDFIKVANKMNQAYGPSWLLRMQSTRV